MLCLKHNRWFKNNLFRHGARTPILSSIGFCKIADTSAYESYGIGELTNEGKEQEYKFGSFLRYRYNDYLSARYKSEDLYAYASDVSRVKASLEYVLNGLYPPVQPANWNAQLKWSRVPYIYTPKNLDTFLGSFRHPKFLRTVLQNLKSREIRSHLATHSNLINFVKQKEVIKNCSSSLLHIALAYDVLVANEHMKLPLAKWYTPDVREHLEELVELALDTLITGTKEMQKLGAGSLVKTFIGNLNLNGKNEKPKKMYLYAGHDVNLHLFARAHGLQPFRIPPFGSAVILEKFHDPKNQTYVRLLAWDGIDRIRSLKLEDHSEFCPVEDYLRITEAMLPSEKETDELLDEFLVGRSGKRIRSLLYDISSGL
ncbi:venom acid phosphatase Acph-1-like [Phymastichus coffea]|uniref:venom acid phosphatase Acph-1-like n=1 Tax=Phymastichus coffea TaxID=108790 RepID=UPI00273A96BD|nr:venom acid phosphatase Acph-1-like [Phymastichus coffea]